MAIAEKRIKPLGGKSYGHIPHLPGSRTGPGDHTVNDGQDRICTKRARDRHDLIIVQEKLDGSNCAVARIGDDLVPLIRSGYHAWASRYEQHHLFAIWVQQEAWRFSWLDEGERVCGEWLAQAHGTRYALRDGPFVAFDLMRGSERQPVETVVRHCCGVLPVPRLIHQGGPISIREVLGRLEPSGHGALDPVEGAVWRVERKGTVDFLAKFVRPGKVDGCYLPDVSGQPAIWNWRPKGAADA